MTWSLEAPLNLTALHLPPFPVRTIKEDISSLTKMSPHFRSATSLTLNPVERARYTMKQFRTAGLLAGRPELRARLLAARIAPDTGWSLQAVLTFALIRLSLAG